MVISVHCLTSVRKGVLIAPPFLAVLGVPPVKNLKIIITTLMLSTIFLQGCSTLFPPKYETYYSYLPAKGAEAKSCFLQCSLTENQCEQLVQMTMNNCQTTNSMKKQNCETQATNDYNNCLNSGGGKSCVKNWCMDGSCNVPNNCKQKYNRCYTTCGGVVSSETRCVDNCKK